MTREAKIAACPVPEHVDAGVSIISVWGGGYSVQCNKDKGLCWSGPRCKTPAEAVARWNEVVGARLKLNEIGVLPIAYVADTDLHHVNDPHETRRRVIVLPIEDKP